MNTNDRFQQFSCYFQFQLWIGKPKLRPCYLLWEISPSSPMGSPLFHLLVISGFELKTVWEKSFSSKEKKSLDILAQGIKDSCERSTEMGLGLKFTLALSPVVPPSFHLWNLPFLFQLDQDLSILLTGVLPTLNTLPMREMHFAA